MYCSLNVHRGVMGNYNKIIQQYKFNNKIICHPNCEIDFNLSLLNHHFNKYIHASDYQYCLTSFDKNNFVL